MDEAPDTHRSISDGTQAFLILGASLDTPVMDLSEADDSFVGNSESSGFSVSCAGDVDGNGRDDLLVGAKGNNEGGNGAG